jgi:hypothetical protein
MKRILLLLVLASSCLVAQQDARITYLATQASVQDITRSMAAQAGLGYNWQKSFDQTNPLCRRWVRDVRIEAVSFETAMHRILRPVGLRYEVENGVVVLFLGADAIQSAEGTTTPPDAETLINYSTAKKSIQYIVIDLAAQMGLGYNWEKSFAQTDPECREFVFDASITNLPFAKAMAEILDPVGLRFEVEVGRVVLYRR